MEKADQVLQGLNTQMERMRLNLQEMKTDMHGRRVPPSTATHPDRPRPRIPQPGSTPRGGDGAAHPPQHRPSTPRVVGAAEQSSSFPGRSLGKMGVAAGQRPSMLGPNLPVPDAGSLQPEPPRWEGVRRCSTPAFGRSGFDDGGPIGTPFIDGEVTIGAASAPAQGQQGAIRRRYVGGGSTIGGGGAAAEASWSWEQQQDPAGRSAEEVEAWERFLASRCREMEDALSAAANQAKELRVELEENDFAVIAAESRALRRGSLLKAAGQDVQQVVVVNSSVAAGGVSSASPLEAMLSAAVPPGSPRLSGYHGVAAGDSRGGPPPPATSGGGVPNLTSSPKSPEVAALTILAPPPGAASGSPPSAPGAAVLSGGTGGGPEVQVRRCGEDDDNFLLHTNLRLSLGHEQEDGHDAVFAEGADGEPEEVLEVGMDFWLGAPLAEATVRTQPAAG